MPSRICKLWLGKRWPRKETFIRQKILSRLREDLFTHIENLSHEQLNQIPVGKLVTRVANDTDAISRMFTNILVTLIKNCFVEIEELLKELIPQLSQIAENGVERNKLIEKQKQKINEYFGDNIIEASQFLKDSADKILSMMFYNFFQ